MKTIIGLTGRRRAGKDTFAASCINLLGPDKSQRLAFADALKHQAAFALSSAEGFPVEFFINEFNDAETKEAYRPFLQWYGTEFVRKILNRPNRWIDTLRNQILESNSEYILITDVRSLAEVTMLKEFGATIIRLTRAQSIYENKGVDLHETERAADELPADISFTCANPMQILEVAMSFVKSLKKG